MDVQTGRTTLVRAEHITGFCVVMLLKAGVSRNDAHIVACNLVEADLRGVGSRYQGKLDRERMRAAESSRDALVGHNVV